MKVEATLNGSVVILKPQGRLTIEEDTRELQETLDQHISNDTRDFLLDMSRIRSMDAFGIGRLVTYYKRTRNNGGTLKLLRLSERLRRLLDLAQLLTIFETFDNEDEALASFPFWSRASSVSQTTHRNGGWRDSGRVTRALWVGLTRAGRHSI